MKELLSDQRNASYTRKENFVFYPHEPIVRFMNKYVRKRVGYNTFDDISATEGDKLLVFGCGIGRHAFFGNEFGLESYGIDISDKAIETAQSLAEEKTLTDTTHFQVTNGKTLPFDGDTFNCIISHGVFDSMYYDIAHQNILECARVLQSGGYIYFDVIDGSCENKENEEIVQTEHEMGTVQSYFDVNKIKQMLEGSLQIVEIILHTRYSVLDNKTHGRYSVIAKK